MIQARPDFDPQEFALNYGTAGIHWFPLAPRKDQP
jgi:hypothetical protein